MQFNSKSLQSAFNSAKPVLDRIEELKDAVSEDIKKLESCLKQYNLTETISYSINGSEDTFEQECILWDPEKNRLIFKLLRYPSEERNYDKVIPRMKQDIAIEKPLIEMPFDVRKRALTVLGDFLEQVAKTYDETYSNDLPF